MPKKKTSAKSNKTEKEEPEKQDPESRVPTVVTQVVEVVEVEESEPETKETEKPESKPKPSAPEAEPAAEEEEPAAPPEKEQPADVQHPKLHLKKAAPDAPPEISDQEDEETTYEEVSEENGHGEPPPEKTAVSRPETDEQDKQKQVVEELFTNKSRQQISDIDISGKKSGKPAFWWAVIVVVAALTTGAGLFIFSGRSPGGLPGLAAKPTPTPSPAPTAAPTPAPAVTRENITIQVLNGGGVAGAAGKMKDFLTNKGYQVSDMGNADAYTYDQTVILVKPGDDAALNLLKSDLESDYTIGSASATLSSDVSYDARVIVGKE